MNAAPRHCRPSASASGFTLLEVILALAILGAALAIFGEVMQLANRNAVDARAETQAQLLAESVMDQILAGVIEASQATAQPLEVTDGAPWLYSIVIGTAEYEGVYPLEVIVEQDLEKNMNPVSFRLIRWLSTADETDENAEESDAAQQQSGGGSAS